MFYPSEPTYMDVIVIAKFKQGALKIAKEIERQAIAEGWWGQDRYNLRKDTREDNKILKRQHELIRTLEEENP